MKNSEINQILRELKVCRSTSSYRRGMVEWNDIVRVLREHSDTYKALKPSNHKTQQERQNWIKYGSMEEAEI